MGNQTVNANHKNIDALERKKRVKRMKTLIITGIITLILIPILLCISLIIKVQKLEDKMEAILTVNGQLYVDNSENPEDLSNKGNHSLVYAAEIEGEEDFDGEWESQGGIPKGINETAGDSDTFDENSETNQENFQEEDLILTPEEKLDIELSSKKVYLTFDDGPGKYTDELLDILAENDVKATFFVNGKNDEHSRAMYKRIIEEGHTLAMHSYSHQYSQIYKSVKAFDKDFNKISDLLYEYTGIRPTMYRFPGGSSNLVSGCPMTEFIRYLNDKNITYFDWNVINGDATGKDLTPKQMIKNVMSGVRGNNNSMVLMHDSVSKDTTVKSVNGLIMQLKKEGYTILPITKYTDPIQHIKADSIE